MPNKQFRMSNTWKKYIIQHVNLYIRLTMRCVRVWWKSATSVGLFPPILSHSFTLFETWPQIISAHTRFLLHIYLQEELMSFPAAAIDKCFHIVYLFSPHYDTCLTLNLVSSTDHSSFTIYFRCNSWKPKEVEVYNKSTCLLLYGRFSKNSIVQFFNETCDMCSHLAHRSGSLKVEVQSWRREIRAIPQSSPLTLQ